MASQSLYRRPKAERVTLTSGFRGRDVILVPDTANPDWRLFTGACEEVIQPFNQRYRTLDQLRATIDAQARAWNLRVQVVADLSLASPIEVEVRDA